jgi:O-antigen/teichoic acid export membrane protein
MKIPFFQGELIRRGSLVLVATLLASIISFFANIAISSIIGPKSFGDFKTIVYLFAFLPVLVDLGINASLTKYIAEYGKLRLGEAKHLIVRFLEIKLLSYVILVSATLLVNSYIAVYFLKDVSLNQLVFAGIVYMALSFFTVFNFIILGIQNFKLFSVSTFLSPASSALLALLLSPFGIFYMIIGWALGPLIGNLANIVFLLKNKFFSNRIKTDFRKVFFKFSLPIFPVELSTNLYTVIIPLLSLFFNQEMVGYYSFAFMFYYAAQLIPNSLSSVLFPKVSELNGLGRHDHAKDILRRSFLYYGLIVVIGLAFVLFLSEWFITLIAKEYLPSLLMFKAIASMGFIFGFNVIYVNYLKGLGKVRRYAIFSVIQTLILIAVSFILLNSQI